MRNPKVKEVYSAKAEADVTTYNLAIKDFYHVPVITEVKTGTYQGMQGDTITIIATDDIKVMGVMLQVLDSNDNVMEAGNAIQQMEKSTWIYTASASYNSIAGAKLVVEARDLAGNKTSYKGLL